MKLLWSSWPALKKKIQAKGKTVLILDFDGTLSPIASRPQDAVLSSETRGALKRLCASPAYHLVVISGRGLKDLKKRFGSMDLAFVGNHGLEVSGSESDLPAEARKARDLKFLIFRLVEKMRKDFYYLPGILIEDKGLTMSVHFRNLDKEYHPAFNQALDFLKEAHSHHPIVWRKGKKVWEIFPDICWDKGRAALHFLKKHPGALPVVIGDDKTDEDMFKALKGRGITIRVGATRSSAADYYVSSQKEVLRLLEELAAGDARPASRKKT